MARDQRTIPWRLVGLGMELGLTIGGLSYLGYWADRRFETSPWLALVGVLLGMTVGCYTLAAQVLASEKKKKKDKQRSQ